MLVKGGTYLDKFRGTSSVNSHKRMPKDHPLTNPIYDVFFGLNSRMQ